MQGMNLEMSPINLENYAASIKATQMEHTLQVGLSIAQIKLSFK